MTSQPTSGPGSGVIASTLTTISSAQLKAMFTTPVAVSPTPRSNELCVPVHWVASATDSDGFYIGAPGQGMALGYSSDNELVLLGNLLLALTSGAAAFFLAEPATLQAGIGPADARGLPVVMFVDTQNLTTGDFGIDFTLYYALVS